MWCDGKNDVVMWHSVGLRILVKVFKNSLKVSCLKYFGIHVYLGYQYH